MKKILTLVFSAGVALAQTTPPTMQWTTIAAGSIGGFSSNNAQTKVGYDKMEYDPVRKIHCGWNSSKTQNLSEPNNAQTCYSYERNRYDVYNISPFSAIPYNSPPTGHSNGAYVFARSPYNAFFQYGGTDGSGSNSINRFMAGWFVFDPAGPTGQNREMIGGPWMNNTTAINSAVYDQANQKIVMWAAYSPGGTVVTAVIDPATNAYTLYTAAQTGTQPSSQNDVALVYDSTRARVYAWGEFMSSMYQWNTATNTWTALSTTCVSSAGRCVGNNPPTRKWTGMAYSAVDDRVLMAGGVSGATAFTDTWTFNPATLQWTELVGVGTYPNNTSNAIGHKVTYDEDSNVFLMQQSNNNAVYVFPLSTPLAYGRTSSSFSPTASSMNRTQYSGTDTSQSWAMRPSITYDSGTALLYAGWIESFNALDSSSCSNGSFHPYVESINGSGTRTGMPTGTQASACAALDTDSATTGWISSIIKVIRASSNTWSVWSKQTATNSTLAVYAKSSSNGITWSGGAIPTFTPSATVNPNLGDAFTVNGTPTVAQLEWNVSTFIPESNLWVAQWNGSSWVSVGSARLNLLGAGTRAMSVSLASDGTNPIACWAEEKRGAGSRQDVMTTVPQINCATWNGSSWVRFGSTALNHDAGTYAYNPVVTYMAGKPYVAWTERAQGSNPKLWLCRWEGSACTFLTGAALNTGANAWAQNPTITNDGTNVYIGWEEQPTLGQKNSGHAARWNGTTLTALGTLIAADTTNGSVEGSQIVMKGSTPVMIWGEVKPGSWRQIYAKEWSGSAWVAIGTTATAPTITTASLPDGSRNVAYSQTLAATGTTPITWSLTTGGLPPGITLAANGVVSGVPTKVGSWSFGVTAANGVLPNATASYTIKVTSTYTASLTVQEKLYAGSMAGLARTGEAFCLGVPIPDSEAFFDTTTMQLTGASSGQFRVLGRWVSGNIRWVEACGILPSLSAGTTAGVTFAAAGSGNFGGSNLATDNGATITIATGAGTFVVTKAGEGILTSAVVGAKTLISAASGSLGLVVAGPNPAAALPGNVTCLPTAGGTACTNLFSSSNDSSSTATIESNGPVQAVIKKTGCHKTSGGANSYMCFTARLYFVANKTSVRVRPILRNADHAVGGTATSAYKGHQGYELRIKANLSGTLNYIIATHNSTSTGTLNNSAGTDSCGEGGSAQCAYIYQAESTMMKNPGWCTGGTWATCVAPASISGYSVIANGSAATTGTSAQWPAGWADLTDSSGAGIEIGQYLMAAFGNKSLEFRGGGSDIRIGLWAGQNNTTSTSTLTPNKPYYLSWPAHSEHDILLNFHETALASPANDFLKYQHPLVARATVAAYNTAQVFGTPILSSSEEDAYYANLVATAVPAITPPIFNDLGTSDTANFPLHIWRFYSWSLGSIANQMDYRFSYMMNFISRGMTGRLMGAEHFLKMMRETTIPRSDGFSWVSFPGQVRYFGFPTAQPQIGGGTASINATLGMQNFVAADMEHGHTAALFDHYFISGDEASKDAANDFKDCFLAVSTINDQISFGQIYNQRAVGNVLINIARGHAFLEATGDSANAAAILARGQVVYNLQIKPDLCLSGFPSGCVVNYPMSGTTPNVNRGLSRVRGTPFPYQSEIPTPSCPNSDYRIAAGFQQGIMSLGMWQFRREWGTAWTEYELARQLEYGAAKWAQQEMMVYLGTSSWTGDGFRFYQLIGQQNSGGPCGFISQFGVQNPNAFWPLFRVLGEYEGVTSGWATAMGHIIQSVINGGASIRDELFGYTLALPIDMTLRPPAAPLSTVAITSFTNNGGGSYTLGWSPPSGVVSYTLMAGTKTIVDWIGYNPSSATFSGNPNTTQNFWGSTLLTTPSVGASSITVSVAGQPALTIDKFMLKAYATGVSTTPTSVLSDGVVLGVGAVLK
jgi:hypothetical protein